MIVRVHLAGPSRTASVAASALCLSLAACGGEETGGKSDRTGTPDAEAPALPEGRIPAANEACPTLATGNVTVAGQGVQLWVGTRQEDRKGPVLFYWHGTGSVSAEAAAFMQPQIDEIVAEGGLVASFTTSVTTDPTTYTGPFVWHEGDLDMADTILACATQQLNIDMRRIYSAGCSAGGLQASYMAYKRSSYIAAVMPNSGGTGIRYPLEDPEHVPSVIATHGALGADRVVIEFTDTSRAFAEDIASHGGFAVRCDHGGGHCGATPEIVTAQWQFLKDHPFGVDPKPYTNGLPASFPSYCEIAQPAPAP